MSRLPAVYLSGLLACATARPPMPSATQPTALQPSEPTGAVKDDPCPAFGIDAKATERYRWLDNRCEGVVGEPQAANTGIDLRSFVRRRRAPANAAAPAPAMGAALLTWPGAAEESYELVVQTLSGRKYYRVFAKVDGSTGFHWPQTELRRSFPGTTPHLGYVVRAGDTIRPVTTLGMGDPQDADRYDVELYSDHALVGLKAALIHSDEQAECRPAPGALSPPPDLLRDHSTLRLRIDSSRLPCSGTYRLTMGARKARGGARVQEPIHFVHEVSP